ncbi:MAG TPA: FAD-binding oxidoreductase [Bryobacteraceae bacterium]|jgi:FAD/FMN-containing dehydrogenase|nr:FAD-binding oxidoreductase [Bryobacteraceae bacterium]
MDSYLIDASGFKGRCEKVFAPASETELLDILSNASASKVPVTISGAGTGVTGGRVAQSGWVISMEKFQRVEIHQGHATAGAGVSLEALQAAAGRSNQFYAPDPTENFASIGGNIATDASGSRSFRYGSTRKHILGLRAVLMDRRVLHVKRGDKVDFDVPEIPLSNTTKNTAGYLLRPGMDWIDLFAGSEGTLGIVIEAELRLFPKPADVLAGVVFLPNDEAALDAVEQWRGLDGLRMLEYFDRNSLAFLRQRFSETPEHAGAALLIEQENGDIDFWADHAPEDSWFAASDQDRERFRRFRHALPELVNDTMRRRGFLKLNTDFAVPLARNREMLNYYHARLRESGIDYVLFGHIGDAHLHVNVLPNSDVEFQSGQRLLLDFARHAVELGGTVSAEHGLGKRKAHLLELQYTQDQIESMKAVKRRLDPAWLLNQGNLFPQ